MLDHYQIYTADDADHRDPTTWEIYRLKDNPSNWQKLGRALHWPQFPRKLGVGVTSLAEIL